MLRRFFPLASALSLVLFAAAVVLWVRSYWRYENVGRTSVESVRGERSDWTIRAVACVWGHLTVEHIETRNYWSLDPPVSCWHSYHSPTSRQQWVSQIYGGSPNALGFGRFRLKVTGYKSQMVQTTTTLTVPLWLVNAVCAILPATAVVRRWRHAHRSASGCCIRCGYDLRATPDRCPECWTLVTSVESSAQVIFADGPARRETSDTQGGATPSR